MEVHHHTHPSPSSGHRKKWTHYFWEFLMLFLAVSCGFFAEYQLEHKIEKDRERQFVKSLLADLKKDQAAIQLNIDNNNSRIELLDSLLTIITHPESLRSNGNNTYYFARVGPRIFQLTTNNKTFDQLKNSGGFRLIRTEIANRIMEYYNSVPHILTLETLYFNEFAQYKNIAAKLFEPSVFRAMENSDGSINREANNPALRTGNTELLKEFGISIVYMNGTIRSIVPAENELLLNGQQLIGYLKEKYGIRE
jgi:hypothetical protein